MASLVYSSVTGGVWTSWFAKAHGCIDFSGHFHGLGVVQKTTCVNE